MPPIQDLQQALLLLLLFNLRYKPYLPIQRIEQSMWELDHKEGSVLKNQCFWIVVLEKTLESPLDSKEIKPVNPKVNQS